MNCLRFTSLFLLLFTGFSASAQFHKEVTLKSYTMNVEKTQPRQAWLASQKQNFNQPPLLTSLAAIPFTNKSSYWLGQVTTQSMHEGKMGTFYMWDQQGNLRESRFFMDIGGNKRPGLKLVFPRR
jgi:hypothetical protein